MPAGDDAFIIVRRAGGRTEWQGDARFFRGHRLQAHAGRPDGIYAEWDWNGTRLVVRNDRYGVAPLFYAQQRDWLAVSPSIATLLARGVPADLDESALAVFLRLGFFVGDDTPFRHIRAVPPDATFCWSGGLLSVDGGYAIPRAMDVPRRQALDGFITLFREAMRRRLPADDRAVVPLSGGRDSRHILFELCALGRPPRCAVTVPRHPPRPPEDVRIAPLVARAAGVRHVLLPQYESSFESELAKNWDTHLCADEHGWYMPLVHALERATTIYDGLGGALSVPSRFLSRGLLAAFEAGAMTDLAAGLIGRFAKFSDGFLDRILSPDWRHRLSRERAVARLAAELSRHQHAPDPVKSFNFWNRIRRELALVPYALMRWTPKVYSPYLDRDLYDFLMALPPAVLSPSLSASDKSFHTDAILEAHPQHAHIPFEYKAAPPADASAHHARFGAEVARYLLRHRDVPSHVLNRRHVLPRLALGLASRRYFSTHHWLPPLALYLFQLDAAAAGPGISDRLRPWRSSPDVPGLGSARPAAWPPVRLESARRRPRGRTGAAAAALFEEEPAAASTSAPEAG